MEPRQLRAFEINPEEDGRPPKPRVRLPPLPEWYKDLFRMRSEVDPEEEACKYEPPRTTADLAKALRVIIMSFQLSRRAGRNKSGLKRLDTASDTSVFCLTKRGSGTGVEPKTRRIRLRGTKRRRVTGHKETERAPHRPPMTSNMPSVRQLLEARERRIARQSTALEQDDLSLLPECALFQLPGANKGVRSAQNIVRTTEDTRPERDSSCQTPRPPTPVLLELYSKSLKHSSGVRGDLLPANLPEAVPVSKEQVKDSSQRKTRHGVSGQKKTPNSKTRSSSVCTFPGQSTSKDRGGNMSVNKRSLNPFEMGGGLKTARGVPPCRSPASSVRRQSGGGSPQTNPVCSGAGVESGIPTNKESGGNVDPRPKKVSLVKRVSTNTLLTWFSKRFPGSTAASPAMTPTPPSKPRLKIRNAEDLRKYSKRIASGANMLIEDTEQERPARNVKMAKGILPVVSDTEIIVIFPPPIYPPKPKKLGVFKRLFSKHTDQRLPRPVNTSAPVQVQQIPSAATVPRKGLFGRLWDRVKSVRRERSARVAPMKQQSTQNP